MRQPHRPRRFQQFTSSLQTGWEPKGSVKSRNMKSALKQCQERREAVGETGESICYGGQLKISRDPQVFHSLLVSEFSGGKKCFFCPQAKSRKSKPASVFKRCVPGLWFLTGSPQVWFRGCPIEGAVCLTLNGVAG